MERLTAEDYFRTALTVLGTSGSDALTIAGLCERLRITKGSFYHHFAGLSDFVEQLLAYWATEYSDRLIELSAAQPDHILRGEMLIDFAVGLPHGAEAAIRAWARSSDEVNAAVAAVDKRRERYVVSTLLAVGLDRERARVLTRIAFDVLIGRQMRERRVNRARLRENLDQLNRMVIREAGLALDR